MNTLGRMFTVATVAIICGSTVAYAYSVSAIDPSHFGQSCDAVDVDCGLMPLPLPGSNPQRLASVVTTDAVGYFAFESEGADGPVLRDGWQYAPMVIGQRDRPWRWSQLQPGSSPPDVPRGHICHRWGSWRVSTACRSGCGAV